MATRAKELSDLGNLKLDVTANGIDVVGVGSNFKSESYNILNIQTDTDDSGTSDDGIFKITNGSAGTTKAEFRWDESEDLVHVSYGDHGRHISIGSDGKVGIATGSTAPSQTLDVNGTAIAEQYLLDAIDTDISTTASDVFIYDTRKDSDGGAWRKRTQHTSWYSETLNTATRGSRKEFPAVAVIVCETDKVTIHDGDDPDMPMWMVCTVSSNNFWIRSGAANRHAVAMNGIMLVGTNGGAIANSLLSRMDFLRDRVERHFDGGVHQIDLQGIIKRNNTFVIMSNGAQNIVSRYVNDVAMTVLPNAPIDSATGLPVPTIAVATDGGVSIIRDSGVPTNKSGSAYITIDTVGTDYYVTKSAGDDYSVLKWSDTETSINYTKGTFKFNGNQATNFYPFLYGNGGNVLGATNKLYHSTGVQGVTLWDIEGVTDRNALQCNIGDTHNTGWMPGDIKLATLSDTDNTNVTGAELVTNGTFDSNVTGWTTNGGSSVSHQSGQAKVTASSTNILLTQQLSGLVVGQKYTFSATITPFIGASGNYWGAYLSSSYSNNIGEFNVTDQVATKVSATFTATATNNYISIGGSSGAISNGEYLLVDNFSVRLAEQDRSVNRNGLQVFGTVTKSAVATGADLVAYSGFSSSNYLEQPYNSDLNFGTGDFSVMGWFKTSATAAEQMFLDRSTGSANIFRARIMSSTSKAQFAVKDNVTWAYTLSDRALDDNSWHFLCGTKIGGTVSLYIDGDFQASAGGLTTTISSSTSPTLDIGHEGGTNPATNSSLALWRVSATGPSAEQIKKIYNDEKHLFQENAKATLYGSSGSAVTALAYDDEKELLHTGTSAGRSVFQGLTRIDNTTDAVGAAISASNGMVAED